MTQIKLDKTNHVTEIIEEPIKETVNPLVIDLILASKTKSELDTEIKVIDVAIDKLKHIQTDIADAAAYGKTIKLGDLLDKYDFDLDLFDNVPGPKNASNAEKFKNLDTKDVSLAEEHDHYMDSFMDRQGAATKEALLSARAALEEYAFYLEKAKSAPGI